VEPGDCAIWGVVLRPLACRDLYLTTYNTHNRQTFMSPAGLESTTPASKQPQNYALDRSFLLHFIQVKAPSDCLSLSLRRVHFWKYWTKFCIVWCMEREKKIKWWTRLTFSYWLNLTSAIAPIWHHMSSHCRTEGHLMYSGGPSRFYSDLHQYRKNVLKTVRVAFRKHEHSVDNRPSTGCVCSLPWTFHYIAFTQH